jgi:hypothetical protein
MSFLDRIKKLEQFRNKDKTLDRLRDPRYSEELYLEMLTGQMIPTPPIELFDAPATARLWATDHDAMSHTYINRSGNRVSCDDLITEWKLTTGKTGERTL